MPNRYEMPPSYLQSGDPEQENNPVLSYPGLLGARFTVIQATRAAVGAESGRSKRYQLIRTDSTMTVNPYAGATAWWADKTQYMVTTSPTALGRGRVAGVFQNAITPGYYGCIQFEGPATVKLTDGSAVTANSGQFVIPSATAGKATTEAVGTAASYPALGVISGTLNAAAMTVIVDLNVPETT